MVGVLAVWGLVAVLGVAAFAPVVYDARRGRVDPFSPQVWFAMVVFSTFGIAAATRLSADDFSFTGNYVGSAPETTTMAVVLVAVILGTVAFHVGYRWSGGRRVAARLPRFRTGWSSRRAVAVAGAAVGVGGAAYVALVANAGGATDPQLARGGSRVVWIGTRLLDAGAVIILATAVIHTASRVRATDSTDTLRARMGSLATPRTVGATAIAAGAVVAVIAALYSIGLRTGAFSLALVAITLVHYLWRRFSLAELSVPLAVYVFLPEWTLDLVLEVASGDPGGVLAVLTHPYFGLDATVPAFNNLVILFAGVPERVGYQGGVTFAAAFFEVGPLHPFPEAHTIYNTAFLPAHAGYGAPISLIGELYLNFWWAGIPIGMALFGVGMRTYYEWFITYDGSVAARVLFAGVGSMFLLGGNFSNALPNLGVAVLPLLLSLLIIVGGAVGPSTVRETASGRSGVAGRND